MHMSGLNGTLTARCVKLQLSSDNLSTHFCSNCEQTPILCGNLTLRVPYCVDTLPHIMLF